MGGITFILNGIEKSTPVRIASPSPKTGRYARISELAEEQDCLIASLSL